MSALPAIQSPCHSERSLSRRDEAVERVYVFPFSSAMLPAELCSLRLSFRATPEFRTRGTKAREEPRGWLRRKCSFREFSRESPLCSFVSVACPERSRMGG